MSNVSRMKCIPQKAGPKGHTLSFNEQQAHFKKKRCQSCKASDQAKISLISLNCILYKFNRNHPGLLGTHNT